MPTNRNGITLCAVSPFFSAPTDTIIDYLTRCDHDLVLLPGYRTGMPTPAQVQRVVAPGVHVFVEQGLAKQRATPYLVTHDAIHAMPKQIFERRPTEEQVDALVGSLSQRTFPIAGRRVTFIICGEINAFNPNGALKYGRQQLPLDIVANPAHTLMGHWNHLGKKLAALSRHTACLYATNNNKNRTEITTDTRIYSDGLLSGKKMQCERLSITEIEI